MTSPLHRRTAWSADRQPVCSSTNIRPEGITVHYTGPTDWRQQDVDRSSPARFEQTTDHDRCAPTIRAHRDYHMDARAGCFLFYNEVACPHGHRYESRPPGERSGAQGTNDGNLRSYAVLYLAGQGDPLTVSAKTAILDTPARFGVPLKWGHQDWKATACPGDPVYAWRLAGFPPPATTAPDPVEDEMRAFELIPPSGAWLLILGGSAIPYRSGADRDAARAILADAGIPVTARKVDAGTYAWWRRWLLAHDPVDPQSIAAAIAVELGGGVDATVVEAAVRRVFAAAATAG